MKNRNFVRSKYYAEDISKEKRKLISENPLRGFKIADEHLTYNIQGEK